MNGPDTRRLARRQPLMLSRRRQWLLLRLSSSLQSHSPVTTTQRQHSSQQLLHTFNRHWIQLVIQHSHTTTTV